MKSSTETIIGALRILAVDIQSGDGVANAAIIEAANRMEELNAAAVAQQAAPQGYKLVPIKPTPCMIDSTFNDRIVGESHNARNRRIYAAMLAAAPNMSISAPKIDTSTRCVDVVEVSRISETPILNADELGKVKEAKRVMVDAMIASAMNHGTCGVVSFHLNKLIDSLAAPQPLTAGLAAPEAHIATLKKHWTGVYWNGVSHSERDAINEAFAALAAPVPQVRPSESRDEASALREEQARAVMPLIGPLLDAYEGAQKEDLEEVSPDLLRYLRAINQGMEGAAPVVARPDLPIMRKAFRTTVAGGDLREYSMVFRFESWQAMHDADDEWRLFAKPAPDAPAAQVFDFVQALAVATGVFDQYKTDQFKWWRKMDGTPILNDVAVRMAEAFRDAAGQQADKPQVQPSEVLAWQPIETAPKNGRTLLLGRFNSLGNWRTMRGQWFTKEQIDEDWEETDGFDAGWYETAVEPDYPNCWPITPTHWQLTPAVPSGKQGGA